MMFLDSPPSTDNDPPFEDYPVDQRSCRLLGPTALIVQALLGVLVILSLVSYSRLSYFELGLTRYTGLQTA